MKITGYENNAGIMAELGQRIKDTRIAMNYTQTEMEEQSGVALRTILRIEKGESVNFESILKQKIDYARKIIASNLTEEELFDLLNLVFLDSARRRFENDDLKSIYKRRIKSWKR